MLSIGMAVYRDFDGVYFSVQALRLYHREATKKCQLIVVDNAPSSPEGQRIKRFVEGLKGVDDALYVPMETPVGTSPSRNKIFEVANRDWVMVMDSHVFVAPGAIDQLLDYIQQNPNSRDLLSGPLLYDNLINVETHFIPKWRGGMYGIWGRVPDDILAKGEPFEIPAMGLGLFVMRKAVWPGFHPLARGFGGEEVYIHEKVRRNGGVCLCLPFLKWLHRFNESSDILYPLRMWDRIRNYVLEFKELNWNVDEVRDYFVGQGFITQEDWDYLMQDPEGHIDPPQKNLFLDPVRNEVPKPQNKELLKISSDSLAKSVSKDSPPQTGFSASFEVKETENRREVLEGEVVDSESGQDEAQKERKGCCPEASYFEKRQKERENLFQDILRLEWRDIVNRFRKTSYLWKFQNDFRELLKDSRVIVDITDEPVESTLFLAEVATEGDIIVLAQDFVLFREFDVLSRKLKEYQDKNEKKQLRFLVNPDIYRYEFVTPPDVIFVNNYPSDVKDSPIWTHVFRFFHETMRKMSGYVIFTRTNYYVKPGQPVYNLIHELLQTFDGTWGLIKKEEGESGYWVLSNKPGLKRYETGFLEQAASYAKSLFKRVIGQNKRVSDEEAEKRWQICLTCPYRDQNRCTICGCFLKEGVAGDGKIYWSDEHCPKGYW